MSKKSRKQVFIYEIEKKILSGEWEIGDKLPSERELVEKYKTSRTVVNAALAELAQKGFLSINPRKWTMVADYKKDGKLEVLYSMVKHNEDKVDIKVLQGVLDARRLVEIESIKLATKQRTSEDIAQLEEILDMEAACKNLQEKVALDFKFHHMLTVASKNPVYPLIMNSFKPIANKYVKMFYSLINDSHTVNVKHIEIVNALKVQDSKKAVELLDAMLLEGEQILRIYGGKENE